MIHTNPHINVEAGGPTLKGLTKDPLGAGGHKSNLSRLQLLSQCSLGLQELSRPNFGMEAPEHLKKL